MSVLGCLSVKDVAVKPKEFKVSDPRCERDGGDFEMDCRAAALCAFELRNMFPGEGFQVGRKWLGLSRECFVARAEDVLEDPGKTEDNE